MKIRTTIWIIAGLLLLTACSPRSLVVRQMADVVAAGVPAFERDGDLELVERSIPANIKLLEALLASDPNNPTLLTLLAQLYGSYAFGFVESRVEALRYQSSDWQTAAKAMQALKYKANRYYEKGAGYALAALDARYAGAEAALAKPLTIDAYLAQLKDKDADALFWYGFNLGAWVNSNLDSIRAVSRAHVARRVMERVIQLDETTNHGGAHLFLLAYFGSRPTMMGGSQERAERHYLRLKEMVGENYRMADLFYGRFCLHQRQDRQEFVRLMQTIVDHKQSDGDLALYNAVAVRRAQIYLQAVDSLFE